MRNQPHYPHPGPPVHRPERDSPAAADIRLPSVATLEVNIRSWLGDVAPDVTLAPKLNLLSPGAVLVLANGQEPFPGRQVCQVLNAEIADLRGFDAIWRRSNNFQNLVRLWPSQVPNIRKWLLRRYLTNPAIALLAKRSVQKLMRNEDLVIEGSVPPSPIPASHPVAQEVIGSNLDLLFEDAIVSSSQTQARGGLTCGQYEQAKRRIVFNAHAADGSGLPHEFLHTCEANIPEALGWHLDEGITDFFALDISKFCGYSYTGNPVYERGYDAVRQIVERIGIDTLCRLYFESSASADLLASARELNTLIPSGEATASTEFRNFC